MIRAAGLGGKYRAMCRLAYVNIDKRRLNLKGCGAICTGRFHGSLDSGRRVVGGATVISICKR